MFRFSLMTIFEPLSFASIFQISKQKYKPYSKKHHPGTRCTNVTFYTGPTSCLFAVLTAVLGAPIAVSSEQLNFV